MKTFKFVLMALIFAAINLAAVSVVYYIGHFKSIESAMTFYLLAAYSVYMAREWDKIEKP